jgi:hypothetical protein
MRPPVARRAADTKELRIRADLWEAAARALPESHVVARARKGEPDVIPADAGIQ